MSNDPTVPPIRPGKMPSEGALAKEGEKITERLSELTETVAEAPNAVLDASLRTARTTAATSAHSVEAAEHAVEVAEHVVTERITVIETAAHEEDFRHWNALLACCLAIAATAIDPPVLQASSSAVQGVLRISPATTAQILGLGLLVQAGFMVMGGTLGDAFGRRRVMLIGLVALAVFYTGMAFARDLGVVTFMSLASDCAAAVVIPLALANVMVTFGQRALPIAVAIFLSVQLVASFFAPSLGQLMYQVAGQPGTFFIPIALSVIAFVVVSEQLPENRAVSGTRLFDLTGQAGFAIGVLLLIYSGVAYVGGWGTLHLAALVVGLLCIGGFFWRAASPRFGTLPMAHVPFRLIAGTMISGVALALVQSAPLSQLYNFLTGVQEYGALAAGIRLLPFVFATLFTSLGIGVALERTYVRDAAAPSGVRRLVFLGMLLAGACVLLMGTFKEETDYLIIGAALIGVGFGSSIANVPRTTMLFRSVQVSLRGTASGLNSAAFLVGNTLSWTLMSVLMSTAFAATALGRLTSAGLSAAQAEVALHQIQVSVFLASAHPYEQPSWLQIVQDLPGFDRTFTDVIGGLTIVAAVVTAILIRVRPPALADSGLAAETMGTTATETAGSAAF